MNDYIIRKEQCGYFLYDIKTNLVYYSEIYNNIFCSENYTLLSYGKKKHLSSNYFELHKGKYIDNSNDGYKFSAPETVFLEVTKKCNLRCNHCFNSSGKELADELTFTEIKNIINQLSDLGVFNIKVTGGEPFERDDIFNILEYADKKEINYIIFSNGTNFDLNRIENIKKLKHLIKIRISVDGNEFTNDSIRGKGTFRNSLSTLKLLCDNNIPCELNYTITKTNYKQILDVSNYLKNNGINCKINIGFVKISGRAKLSDTYCFSEEEIKEAVEIINKQISDNNLIKDFHLLEPLYYKLFGHEFGCPAGKLTETIKCNGDVYACGLFSDNKNYLCGNVKTTKIIDIWNGETISNIRNLKACTVCNTCRFYCDTCTGACRGNALNYYGDICKQDINCYLYKVFFG